MSTVCYYANDGGRANAAASSRAWHEANRERANANRRAYRQNNLDRVRAREQAWRYTNRDKIRAQLKARYDATVERKREQGRARYAALPEVEREQRRARARARYADPAVHLAARESARQRYPLWAAANPEKIRHNHRQRKARVRGAGGDGLPWWLELDWLAAYGRACVYCGTALSWDARGAGKVTVDHVQPLVLGGTHDLANLVPACKGCNDRKGPALLRRWRTDLAGVLEAWARHVAARLRRIYADSK